jgi:hypothetical protein
MARLIGRFLKRTFLSNILGTMMFDDSPFATKIVRTVLLTIFVLLPYVMFTVSVDVVML